MFLPSLFAVMVKSKEKYDEKMRNYTKNSFSDSLTSAVSLSPVPAIEVRPHQK